jgi:hypothetical protein
VTEEHHGSSTSNALSQSSARSLVTLILKSDLHCLGFNKRIVVGGPTGITLSLILSAGLKNPTHLQSRTISLEHRST